MSWLGQLVWIFIGGGLGSLSRFGLTKWMENMHQTLVVGTILSNFLSSLILGLTVGYMLKHELSQNMQMFILIGFCGGFSTFSTFSYENFQLLENGQYTAFAINTVFSVVICIVAIMIGVMLGKQWF